MELNQVKKKFKKFQVQIKKNSTLPLVMCTTSLTLIEHSELLFDRPI